MRTPEEQQPFRRHGRHLAPTRRASCRPPTWTPRIDWGEALESRSEELWEMLGQPNTCVYVAGLVIIRDELDVVFAEIAGSKEAWMRRKAELEAGRRWVELVY